MANVTEKMHEMTAIQLNDWYERHVGYRPQADDPSMPDDELRSLCDSYLQAERDEA